MTNEMTLDELVSAIKSDDPDLRTKAWLNAGAVGAPALKPLAQVMESGPLEVSRAAKLAMWKITRSVGSPGAPGKPETIHALIELLDNRQPAEVRREVMWMLSEIADGSAVKSIAALLGDTDLKEDCRMVLQRIPGDESLAALQAGFQSASDEFKYNLAQSLRSRGVKVDGYASQKLVPNRRTNVNELQ